MLSAVSPCYNEAEGLFEFVRRLTAACTEAAPQNFEIILIDDGSTDDTWVRICQASEENDRIIAVKLSRNHGHQLALSAGLTFARGDRILIIDADLQDPPEILLQMMEEMDRGVDVVYGRRIARHGETVVKKTTAFIFYRIMRALTDVAIPTDTGDFRLMSRRALDVLLSMPEQHRFIRGMVSWIGFVQKPVDYERQPRFVGETKYPFRKMMRFAIDAITGFSTRPLRFATYLGTVVGFLAIILLGISIVDWMLGRTIQGWTSSIGATLFLGSINLFVLGIIGEYLGRLYIEAKRRPLFIVEDVVRKQHANDPTRASDADPL